MQRKCSMAQQPRCRPSTSRVLWYGRIFRIPIQYRVTCSCWFRYSILSHFPSCTALKISRHTAFIGLLLLYDSHCDKYIIMTGIMKMQELFVCRFWDILIIPAYISLTAKRFFTIHIISILTRLGAGHTLLFLEIYYNFGCVFWKYMVI